MPRGYPKRSLFFTAVTSPTRVIKHFGSLLCIEVVLFTFMSDLEPGRIQEAKPNPFLVEQGFYFPKSCTFSPQLRAEILMKKHPVPWEGQFLPPFGDDTILILEVMKENQEHSWLRWLDIRDVR